jgi:hypothetical protein
MNVAPPKLALFMNVVMETYFVHERRHGNLFCLWTFTWQVLLFMNMAKVNWFFHKCGHVKLFCPWTWPRIILQFSNVATESFLFTNVAKANCVPRLQPSRHRSYICQRKEVNKYLRFQVRKKL